MGGKSSGSQRSYSPPPQSGPQWTPQYQPGEREAYGAWQQQEAETADWRSPPPVDSIGVPGEMNYFGGGHPNTEPPQPQSFQDYMQNMPGGFVPPWMQQPQQPQQTPLPQTPDASNGYSQGTPPPIQPGASDTKALVQALRSNWR